MAQPPVEGTYQPRSILVTGGAGEGGRRGPRGGGGGGGVGCVVGGGGARAPPPPRPPPARPPPAAAPPPAPGRRGMCKSSSLAPRVLTPAPPPLIAPCRLHRQLGGDQAGAAAAADQGAAARRRVVCGWARRLARRASHGVQHACRGQAAPAGLGLVSYKLDSAAADPTCRLHRHPAPTQLPTNLPTRRMPPAHPLVPARCAGGGAGQAGLLCHPEQPGSGPQRPQLQVSAAVQKGFNRGRLAAGG